MQDLTDDRVRYDSIFSTLPEWTSDAAAYVREIGERHGRDLVLMRATLNSDSPGGLLIRAADADYIVLARSESPLYERHVLLHELGHWLLGHLDSGTYGCCKESDEVAAERFAHLLAERLAARVRPQRACAKRGIIAAFGSRRHLQRHCA
ncbi:hypothetical protein L3Q67_01830 [Saccharothrix sp. AJ9571]|nr:hypothetical protein L3Q67_01830 [Saccharothrix sp. AJ9571]